MTSQKKTPNIRIAAVGDIHFGENDIGRYQEQFKDISDHADVFVICGDLTQNGYAKEAQVLADELKYCRIPVLGVLGNHDFDKDEDGLIRDILRPVMKLLDEDPVVIKHIGFTGTKGFGGGFGGYSLAAFGEPAMKAFVHEAVEESLKLENELRRLEAEKKVVVLHYSPIPDTLKGEHLEIYPFLGSSRLGESIDTFGADLVLHGHAHHGSPKGQTNKGTPVFNVALAQLEDPKKPYLVFDI
jgi:Icc-related predicted phosphoesterase